MKLIKEINEAVKQSDDDNTGKTCRQCGEGKYRELTQMDDMDGVLHCDKCNDRTDRYGDYD